jgi:hypothetical protein
LRIGTLPAGEWRKSSCFAPGPYSGMRLASKSNANTFKAIHARSDQEE